MSMTLVYGVVVKVLWFPVTYLLLTVITLVLYLDVMSAPLNMK